MSGDPFVKLPDVGVTAPVSPYGRSQRHHCTHALRLDLCEFARIEPSQAPADEQQRLVMAAAVNRLLQSFERVGPRPPVHALPPGMDPETDLGERTPQL